MTKKILKILKFIFLSIAVISFSLAVFTVFFDQAVIVRKDTVYRIRTSEKAVALTFDDGPSPEWTPKILDELKNAGIKATFFMLGEHVRLYPDIARRVKAEGHEIGNHTFDHHVLIYYKMPELEKEITDAERVINDIVGVKTVYFRPPKAWLRKQEKKKVEEMGYKVILWSLNSKDWVTFDDKVMVKYLVSRIKPGDIILFHDSGGVFKVQGGDRHQTVQAIPRLAKKLRAKGYEFVTVSELIKRQENVQ